MQKKATRLITATTDLTDQNISKRTERVHAKLTPLVWEKNILEPLVYHGVDFLESVWCQRSRELSSTSENEALIKRTVMGYRRGRIRMNTDDWVGTRGCLSGTAEPSRNTCLPDDKHVNAPIRNIWSEQRSDVIWRDSWSHVPCDDVHPVRGRKPWKCCIRFKHYMYCRAKEDIICAVILREIPPISVAVYRKKISTIKHLFVSRRWLGVCHNVCVSARTEQEMELTVLWKWTASYAVSCRNNRSGSLALQITFLF